jgi:uncharacterized protein
MIKTRPVSSPILILFIFLNFLLIFITAKYLFLSPWILQISLQTGGLIDPNLITFTLMNVLLIGLLLMYYGRMKVEYFGLKKIKYGLICFISIWITVQGISAIWELIMGNEIVFHPNWSHPGSGYVIGFLIAMVLGTALYEEIAFRGFLLPQFFLLFNKGSFGFAIKIVFAIAISSMIFSLWHIPSLIIIQGNSFSEMIFPLIGLTGAGIILSIAYLRTANLYIPIAIHALINAPTPIFQSTLSPTMLVGILSLITLLIWPLLVPSQSKTFFHKIDAIQ